MFLDTTLISNLEDLPAVQAYIKKQSIYDNNNWFAPSPLLKAQQISNAYRSQKKGTPMVVEYYYDKSTPVSVEMYINPKRISMQGQKMKYKAYTRGGIFYNHWGDDHWQLQISGYTGLAGMKGIEQLEGFYYYSGSLLRYKNIGIQKAGALPTEIKNKVGGTGINIPPEMQFIKDIQSQLSQITSTGVNFINETTSKVQELINNMSLFFTPPNTKPQTAQEQLEARIRVQKIEAKGGTKNINEAYKYFYDMTIYCFPNWGEQARRALAAGEAKRMFSDEELTVSDVDLLDKMEEFASQIPNQQLQAEVLYQIHLLKQKRLNQAITDLQDTIERHKINQETAKEGFADLKDEILDDWRPRNIFIYFEDRVYMGHFDSFSYQRLAETNLIEYDMRFTVTRQIIMLSNNPAPKPIIPTTSAKSSVEQFMPTLAEAESEGADIRANWEERLKYFATKTDKALEDAKWEILHAKSVYTHELEIGEIIGTPMTEERKTQVINWIHYIQQAIS